MRRRLRGAAAAAGLGGRGGCRGAGQRGTPLAAPNDTLAAKARVSDIA